MIAAIAGATGLTGSFCIQELLRNDKITSVISAGRRHTGISHPKLKEVLLSDNKLPESIISDIFICCLGTTMKKAGSKPAFREVDLELPLYLAAELKKHGCRSVSVISSMGANPKSRIFYSRIKGQMEEGMKKTGFESLSVLRPSIIAGPRKEKRPGEKIGLAVMKFIDPVMPSSMKNYRYIYASDIAKALVNSAIAMKPGYTLYLSDEVKKLSFEQ